MSLVDDILKLIGRGWRPYGVAPESHIYDKLECPHARTRGPKKPRWFVLGDNFLCVGCERRCTLERPEGFIIPLPLVYKEDRREPYSLTPMEMLQKKPLLLVQEAAYILNVSERQIYDFITVGILRKTQTKPIRIPAEDVLAELNNLADD